MPRGHQVQVTLFAWSYAEISAFSTAQHCDNRMGRRQDSRSENKPARRSPNEPKGTKIKLVMLCAHGGYKASFEACFVGLGCLEKHNFSSALLENSKEHHGIAWFSHKASPLGPVFGLAVIVPLQC